MPLWLAILLPVLLAYLAGATPFGWLAGKARGLDLREHGSGNIGATNAMRATVAATACRAIESSSPASQNPSSRTARFDSTFIPAASSATAYRFGPPPRRCAVLSSHQS